MRCLSLKQPWATLVILGLKQFEFRSWHTQYRGRLGIHASRTFPDPARALCLAEPLHSVLRRAGFKQSADLPCGAILGTVELVDCFPAENITAILPEGSWESAHAPPERWGWKLVNPLPLAMPLAYPGRLGLFEVPSELVSGEW